MKKLLLIVMALIMGRQVATAQIPSTLGWYEIPNTKLRSVCPGGASNTQCSNVVAAWGSAAFDTSRNRLIVWGGGHNDYYGNEIYALNLNGTPSVARLTEPCSSPDAFNEVCTGSNPPQPQSRHTYDFIEYLQNVDRLFSFSYAWNGFNGGWTYDFGGGTGWHSMNPTGNVPGGQVAWSAYDPNSQKLFLVSAANDGLYTYTFSTNSWARLGSSSGNVGYWSDGVIDPVRKKFVTIGGGESGIYDISGNGPYDRQPLLTTGGDAVINTGYPGLAYDPITGFIVAWVGGDTVYSLNLDTRVWTSVTYPGGPGPAQQDGTNGRWNFSPALGVFVLVNSVDQNAYTFRLTNGMVPPPPPPPPLDTAAPTTPINITASAISQSQINISWTASTDNIGVTGYQVEHCQGASCTNFAQVSTTPNANYSDSGLAAATTYTYRVRAIDAAGNLSSYSLIAAATTGSATPTTLSVGPGRLYQTIGAAIAAAVDGSTIEIDAGVYPNEAFTIAQNNLTIRGMGGLAHLKWGTGDYLTNTSLIPNGKAIIIISGNNITLENIEFSGAKVADQNGAGIRYAGGNLTIRASSFHDNENGILGQGGPGDTLLIERSTFAHNGYCPSACGHNIYIGTMGKLIFRYSKSVDSREGHTLKSRAAINEILSNYLSTKNSDGSYEAEFPSGGLVYFIGNIIEQGDNTGNSSMLGYGAEGVTNPNPALYVINNTFYNWRTAGSVFVQLNGSPTLSIKNNIFAGGGTMLVGGNTDLSSNKTSSMLIDANGGNFRLATGSDAIDAGIVPGMADTYDLIPRWQYVEPANMEARITMGNAIDVGAYESNFSSSPPPPVFPSSPTGLTATVISKTQINLRWNASTGTTSGYIVYRNGVAIASVAGTTYQDTGLTRNTTYSYKVAAYIASTQSGAVNATTRP